MNKGTLRAHLIALLNRTDCPDALADTFISQAIGRIMRTLRIPIMEKQQTYAINSAGGVASINLPVDLLEAIGIYHEGQGLNRVPMHEMVEYQRVATTGTPLYFTRRQGTFLLHPQPTTGTVTLDYYAELPALGADSDTNALTQIASDAITYAALSYASDYFLDERGPLFEGKAGAFLTEIQEQADSAETSGSLQVMRPATTFSD